MLLPKITLDSVISKTSNMISLWIVSRRLSNQMVPRLPISTIGLWPSITIRCMMKAWQSIIRHSIQTPMMPVLFSTEVTLTWHCKRSTWPIKTSIVPSNSCLTMLNFTIAKVLPTRILNNLTRQQSFSKRPQKFPMTTFPVYTIWVLWSTRAVSLQLLSKA